MRYFVLVALAVLVGCSDGGNEAEAQAAEKVFVYARDSATGDISIVCIDLGSGETEEIMKLNDEIKSRIDTNDNSPWFDSSVMRFFWNYDQAIYWHNVDTDLTSSITPSLSSEMRILRVISLY